MAPIDASQVPASPQVRRAWIKFQLELAGYTLSSLARELGVSRSCTRNALRKPYPKMERAIAAKVGVSPQLLWPERYGPDGQPNRKGRWPSTHAESVAQATPGTNGKQQEVA